MRTTADSCPTTSFPLTISGQELLKESLKKKKKKKESLKVVGRGRELHTETAQLTLMVILKLIIQWSNQHYLDFLKYS